MEVLDEHANYHYKDLQEMINSPEYKRCIKLVRQGVKEGRITIHPPLPSEEHYAVIYKLSKWRVFLNNLNKLVRR